MFFRAVGDGGRMGVDGDEIDRVADGGLRHNSDGCRPGAGARKTFERDATSAGGGNWL